MPAETRLSTASHVKETWHLTGDDARETLASTGRLALLKDAVVRLRAADGTSHSRGLAFAVSLVLVQGLVVVVGFAVATGSAGIPSAAPRHDPCFGARVRRAIC